MPPFLRALRPKQWSKNVLLFAALLFAERMTDPQAIRSSVLGFLCFCLLSSSGYVVNDIRDVAADRNHPKKRLRPIAAGQFSVPGAWALAAACLLIGLGGAFALNGPFGLAAAVYLVTTFSYSMFLKHTVLLDVMLIAAGFLVRAVAGALVIGVEASPWFVTCIGFGSLFLGLNKRLAELRLLDGDAGAHREVLQEYSDELLRQLITITTACTLLSYAVFTFLGEHNKNLMLTLPFVLYGMFRYLWLVEFKGEGGEPETVLLQDRPLQVSILLFGVVAVLTLGGAG